MAVMKTKNLLILVLLVSATTLTVWFGSLQNNNIKNIVSETHKQIHSNLRHFGNLNAAKSLSVDDKYLEMLGLLPNHVTEDKKQLPSGFIVGTAVGTSYERKNLPTFIKAVGQKLKPKEIVVFTLDLSKSKIKKLSKTCNVSSSCTLKKFPFDKFPSYLDDSEVKAYKAIAIQFLLMKHPALLWSDINGELPFTSNIKKVQNVARKTGITVWPIRDPTSAYTHPKMFAFFGSKPSEYHFHHMVKADHIFIYNSNFIKARVMLTWVQCSLTEECIAPTGAQGGGCHVTKPLYNYRGCHRFEMSALNLALGSAFPKDSSQYVLNEDNIFIDQKKLQSIAPNIR